MPSIFDLFRAGTELTTNVVPRNAPNDLLLEGATELAKAIVGGTGTMVHEEEETKRTAIKEIEKQNVYKYKQ